MGAGVGAAVGAFFTSTAWAVVLARTILINVALGALTKKLAKRRGDVPPLNVTVRGTTEYRRIVFGRRRVGGVFAFYDVSSSSGSTTKDVLHYVIVLAGHQVSAITDIWLGTERIANSDITAGAVTAGKFSGKVWVNKYLGTGAQTADAGLDALFSAWTSDHRLRGCAYVLVSMGRSDSAFSGGAPQSVSALVDGAWMYDPRLDSTNGGSGSHRMDNPSTWSSNIDIIRNTALQTRWYLTGGSVVNDQSTRLIRYGLREIDSRILDSYIIAAANICDESIAGANAPPSGAQYRYQSNLEVSCGEKRRDILEAILATMAGTAVNEHGQWRIYAGAYDTPTHTLTQDDLRGPIEVQDTDPHTERYNAVSATFVDAAKQYVEQTTIFRTDSAYETQDGGERITRVIDLRGVTDQYQAQRLAEIELRKSRMMRTIKLIGAVDLLKVAKQQTINFSHARYGWSSRVFRCSERQFEFQEEAGRVSLTLQREDSGVYTDMLTADYTTGTSETDVFTNDGPSPPTSLVAYGIPHGVVLQWTFPSFRGGGITFEVWEYSAATPFASATKVWEGRTNQAVLQYTTPGTRYFWVRARNENGQVSATDPAANGLPGTPETTFVAQGNCQVIGNVARKSGGASAWDSHVYSVEKYLDGAQVTFRPDQTNAHLMVGLNRDPTTDQSYTSLDYAWRCVSDGTLEIYESSVGVSIGLPPYTTSTILTVRHDGRRVQYIKDGSIVREVVTGTAAFHMDSSFYTPGASISRFQFGPANPVRPNPWVARGNCIAGVSTASKVGGSNAWDSDVHSVESYTTCHVVAKASQSNAHLMVALNTDPIANQHYDTLDYAWHPEASGYLFIYESGSLVPGPGPGAANSWGPYSPSTEIAITYDGSNVRYYKDRVLQRTVATSAQRFYADSSFYSPGAAVDSLRFGPGPNLELVDTPAIGDEAATALFVAGNASVDVFHPGTTPTLIASVTPDVFPFATEHVLTATGYVDLHAPSSQFPCYLEIFDATQGSTIGSQDRTIARNINTTDADFRSSFARELRFTVAAGASPTFYLYGQAGSGSSISGATCLLTNVVFKDEVIKR